MAITPPLYAPSGSLMPTKVAATPYTYGNLGNNTSAYNIWGSTGNPYLVAGPSYTPGAGAPIVPVPITPAAPVAQPGDNSGSSDYSDSSTTSSPYGLQDHLGDYYNRPSWSYAIPGVSSIYGLTDLARGINPLNFTGKVPDGSQTFDWYEGATDFAGNPITDKFSADSNSGFAGKTEMQTSNKYGWGSDEHFNSLDMDLSGGYGGGKAYTGPMLNAWGSAQDPIAVQAQQAIVTKNNEVAANKQKVADIELAAKKAEQAKAAAASRLDAERYSEYTNQIDSLTAQLGTLQSVNSQQYTDLLGQLETVEGSLTQQINDFDRANNNVYNTYNTNNTFAPSDTITGDTGNWANPAAGVDVNTLGGRTGTTGLNGAPAPTVSWSDTPNSADNTTGTFTSNEMGSTDVTDYGGGNYSVDVSAAQDGSEEVGWEDPGGDSGGGGGGGGGSYIATAATQSLGTAGLTVFNNWRDYMHSWHPTFTTSFGRYRVTAPKIVKAIDSKDNSKELYKEIWDEYLLPIHKLIVDKDDTNALVKYKVMVKELMNKYLKGKE
jgi:hypothetical protein